MTLKAEKFEELISTQLAGELEPQRGKALAAFRQHLIEEAEKPAVAGSLKHDSKSTQATRRELFFWTSAPSLVAACLAVAVTLRVLGPGNPVTPGTNIAGSMPVGASRTEQTEIVSRQDGGVLVNNNVPMRVIHEQTTKTTQWVDPRDHSVYKLTEPGETVNYQEVHPF